MTPHSHGVLLTCFYCGHQRLCLHTEREEPLPGGMSPSEPRQN